jgi:RNA polymerase sigma-70 factor (ECF subfamily)
MSLTFEAFSKLALAELDTVTRIARAVCGREADDIVQETFLRAVQGWQTFELRPTGIRPWLLRIMHNARQTALIKQGRAPSTSAGDQMNELPAAAQAFTVSQPISDIDWQACDERLVHAVADLPEHLRWTILLWAIENLSYQEIADVTNVPIGTVMSRLYRSRTILADRLASLARERRISRE